MNAVDTNVLVRLLVRDDAGQARRARRLLLRAQEEGTPLLVADAVVLETIWVLGSAYALPREEILDALELIADFPALQFQSHDVVRHLIRKGRSERIDLADLFLGLSAREDGCDTTFTFDRRLASSDLFAAVP